MQLISIQDPPALSGQDDDHMVKLGVDVGVAMRYCGNNYSMWCREPCHPWFLAYHDFSCGTFEQQRLTIDWK